MADDLHYKEWETCRKVMSENDQRAHDIRKIGFSLITALIAAEAILIPKSEMIAANKAGISDEVKLAVFSVTLLLIIIVRLMERNYELFIKCSNQRAQVLERNLNLELSEIISDRHRKWHIPGLITSIYISFLLCVWFLGLFILGHENKMFIFLSVFTLIAFLIVIFLLWTGLRYKHGTIDWTFEPMECESGDIIRIKATNIEEDAVRLPVDLGSNIMWMIEDMNGKIIEIKQSENRIVLVSEASHVWEWDTKDNSGIYNLIVAYKKPKINYEELRRKRKEIINTRNKRESRKKEKIREKIMEEYQNNKILKYLDIIDEEKYNKKENDIKLIENRLCNLNQSDKKERKIEINKIEDSLKDLYNKDKELKLKLDELKQGRQLYKLRRRIIIRKKDSKKEEPINLQFFYSFPQQFQQS